MSVIIIPKDKDSFIQLRRGVDFRSDKKPWFYPLKEKPPLIDMGVPMEAMVLYLPNHRRNK